MVAFPDAGRVLVGPAHRRIGVDGAEDLVEAEAVLHRGDVFDQDVAGVFADDRGAQDRVPCPLAVMTLTKPCALAIGDGAVEVVDAIDRDLVRDVFSFASVSDSPTRATSGR